MVPFSLPQTLLKDKANTFIDSTPISELYLGLLSNDNNPSQFHFNSAASYRNLYIDGKTTPSEVVTRLLSDIKKSNETLRAWNQLNFDDILQQGLKIHFVFSDPPSYLFSPQLLKVRCASRTRPL